MAARTPTDAPPLDLLAAAFSLRGRAPAHGPDPFDLAFGDAPRVERWGWEDRRDHVVEVIEGRAAVRAWLGLAPADTCFTAGPKSADSRSGLPAVRYAVAVGAFSNQGTWELDVGADNRIARLVHRPDTLPPPDLEALQRGASGE